MNISPIVFGEKIRLEVPADEVSAEGVEEITQLIRSVGNADMKRYIDEQRYWPEVWSWRWTVPSGPFVGNLPKRVQSHAYKVFGRQLPTATVSEIGNLASRHTVKHATWVIDFDRELNWNQGDYGDEGSCFWTDKPWCLPILKEVGGFAIRVYDPQNESHGVGRGLILAYDPRRDQHFSDNALLEPVKALTDDGGPPTLVVFNGYGQFRKDYVNERGKRYGHMQSLDYARLLAQLLGQSYGKIQFSVNGSFNDPIYVNNEGTSSFVVASETLVRSLKYANVAIDRKIVSRLKGTCHHCGRSVNIGQNWQSGSNPAKLGLDGEHYCTNCWSKIHVECFVCGQMIVKSSDHLIRDYDGNFYVCDTHLAQHGTKCVICENLWHKEDLIDIAGKRKVCPNCFPNATHTCHCCHRRYLSDDLAAMGIVGDNFSEKRPARVCKKCLKRQDDQQHKHGTPSRYVPLPDPLAALFVSDISNRALYRNMPTVAFSNRRLPSDWTTRRFTSRDIELVYRLQVIDQMAEVDGGTPAIRSNTSFDLAVDAAYGWLGDAGFGQVYGSLDVHYGLDALRVLYDQIVYPTYFGGGPRRLTRTASTTATTVIR